MTRKNYDGWCLWHPKEGFWLHYSGYGRSAVVGQVEAHNVRLWRWFRSRGYKIVKVKLQKVEG